MLQRESRWHDAALEQGSPALRERARSAFASAAEAGAAPIVPSPLDRQLARHGFIAPSLRAELRRRVLHDVIEPCARALLGARGTAPSIDRDVSAACLDHLRSEALAT